MKKRFLLLASSLCIISFCCSAEDNVSSKFSYKLYGYVENQVNFNSRKNVEAVGTSVNIMPLPEKLDPNNKDLNAVPSIEMLSINSRLGIDIFSSSVFNSKTSGKIEADFAGMGTSYFVFRIRRAFINMSWEKTELLLGQEWHPMSAALMPTTFESNGGCPFNAFNRSPQVTFKYKTGSWKWSATASYEMQYTSDGPSGKTPVYAVNALMPELFAGVENTFKHFRYGIGGSIKTLRPRTESNGYVVNETVTSHAYMAFGEYNKNNWSVKAKAIYGQNLTNLLMTGGYGVSKEDAMTGEREYTPFNSVTAWLNVVYGKALKVGIFAGYANNLGTDKNLLSVSEHIYGFGFVDGKMIGRMYRIEPHISYTINNWTVGVEGGLTNAGYGNLTANGKPVDVEDVANYRVLGVVQYYF